MKSSRLGRLPLRSGFVAATETCCDETWPFDRSNARMSAMIWCEKCDRDFDVGLLTEDGDCPACGTWLADPKGEGAVPWHFWLVLAAAVIYLGWRAVQGIYWALQQIG